MSEELVPELQAILSKYDLAPVPGGNQVDRPFTLQVGNQNFTVNSPQEAQTLINNSLAQAGTVVRTLEERLAALESEKQSWAAKATEKEEPKQPVADESLQFLGDMANSPSEALINLASKNPKVAETIVTNSPQFKALQERVEFGEFAKQHPFYAADPETVAKLQQFVRSQGMPVTAQTMHLAAGYAVGNGFLPHENVIRAQQQQRFREMANQDPNQQVEQPRYNNVIPFPTQPQPTQYVAPPPRVNGGATQQQTSIMDKINNMMENENLSTEQMRQILTQFDRKY